MKSCEQPADVQARVDAMINGRHPLLATTARRVAQWPCRTTFSCALPAFQIVGTSGGLITEDSPTFVPLPFFLTATEPQFAVIPKRWVVERSFAWLEKCRRLWKNCERKLHTSEQLIVLASLALLLKRH